jgi:hypothetical protein
MRKFGGEMSKSTRILRSNDFGLQSFCRKTLQVCIDAHDNVVAIIVRQDLGDILCDSRFEELRCFRTTIGDAAEEFVSELELDISMNILRR